MILFLHQQSGSSEPLTMSWALSLACLVHLYQERISTLNFSSLWLLSLFVIFYQLLSLGLLATDPELSLLYLDLSCTCFCYRNNLSWISFMHTMYFDQKPFLLSLGTDKNSTEESLLNHLNMYQNNFFFIKVWLDVRLHKSIWTSITSYKGAEYHSLYEECTLNTLQWLSKKTGNQASEEME